MADVVQRPPMTGIDDTWGFIGGIWEFLKANWGYFLCGIVIIVLFIVIYILFIKKEEADKERDEPGYQLYKATKASCELNANPKFIRRTWNWKTLIWFVPPLTPFFWLTFIIKNEHSIKVLNHREELIGYYRGHCKSMDGTINYLLYKKKSFIFFEDLFILKIPLQFKIKKKVRRLDKNNKPELDAKKNYLYDLKEVKIPLNEFLKNMPNKDVRLQATSVEKIGIYYYCPVFYLGDETTVMDYRTLMDGAIVDNTYQIMTTRLLNIGAKQAEKAMLHNPDLLFSKMKPEKTAEEEKIDQ